MPAGHFDLFVQRRFILASLMASPLDGVAGSAAQTRSAIGKVGTPNESLEPTTRRSDRGLRSCAAPPVTH
jgi:hypothetical protein